MPSYRIRPQKPEDAEDVAKVHVQSWQTRYQGILPDDFLSNISLEQRTEMRRKILAEREGVHLAVVEEETEKIVGFSDAGPARDPTGVGSAELYAIYLLEDKKGLGLGSELFSCTVQELTTLGFSSMYLWVLSENTQARRFYERMGGAVDGEKFNDLGGRSYKEVAYAFQFDQTRGTENEITCSPNRKGVRQIAADLLHRPSRQRRVIRVVFFSCTPGPVILRDPP